MAKPATNPVIPEADAKVIKTTFKSAVPELPISMLGFDALAELSAALESDKSIAEETRKKRRFSLTKRDVLLQERDVKGGWYNFGVPTTKLNYTPLSGGRIQISMKNHRDEVIKCNLNAKNMYLAYDIEVALQIGEALNQNVHFHTSAFGTWSEKDWFDQAYVTFTDKK